jgi:peptide/nickel transport system permease protein
MLTDARAYLRDAWWFATFLGLALAITVFAFNLLGDGLRDWLDPRIARS